MSKGFEANVETKYNDKQARFDLSIGSEEGGLVIEAIIVTDFNYRKHGFEKEFICETISHNDAIRLRDYLNEVYQKDEVSNDK